MADYQHPKQGILGSGLRDGLSLHPIRYPWAYDLYNQAVANTWFPNEVQLVQDLADFEKLSDEEKHALKTVISYLNPNELLINKSLAFGIYPYVNAAEAQLYLSKQMWEERAAACNMIPTSTGAAKAVAKVIPEMAGRFDGYFVRVPVPAVSLVDFVAVLERDTTADELKTAFLFQPGL